MANIRPWTRRDDVLTTPVRRRTWPKLNYYSFEVLNHRLGLVYDGPSLKREKTTNILFKDTLSQVDATF